MSKKQSDMMMGNERARKREPLMTTRERFLGALVNALNCSHTNDEILEVMEALNADHAAQRMREVYFKDKRKGTRESALEDVRAYRNFH